MNDGATVDVVPNPLPKLDPKPVVPVPNPVFVVIPAIFDKTLH